MRGRRSASLTAGRRWELFVLVPARTTCTPRRSRRDTRHVEPPDPDEVASREDFIAFALAMSRHFEIHHKDDDWQHWYIGDYLEALGRWLEDGPPHLMHREWRDEIDRESPTWRGVAIMLDAARVKE
jgi:hypothetical protein